MQSLNYICCCATFRRVLGEPTYRAGKNEFPHSKIVLHGACLTVVVVPQTEKLLHAQDARLRVSYCCAWSQVQQERENAIPRISPCRMAFTCTCKVISHTLTCTDPFVPPICSRTALLCCTGLVTGTHRSHAEMIPTVTRSYRAFLPYVLVLLLCTGQVPDLHYSRIPTHGSCCWVIGVRSTDTQSQHTS